MHWSTYFHCVCSKRIWKASSPLLIIINYLLFLCPPEFFWIITSAKIAKEVKRALSLRNAPFKHQKGFLITSCTTVNTLKFQLLSPIQINIMKNWNYCWPHKFHFPLTNLKGVFQIKKNFSNSFAFFFEVIIPLKLVGEHRMENICPFNGKLRIS